MDFRIKIVKGVRTHLFVIIKKISLHFLKKMSSKEKCSDKMMTNPRKADDEQCENISERKCQGKKKMKKKEEENEQFHKEMNEVDEKWNKIYIDNGNNFTPEQLIQYNSEVADVIMKYEGEKFKYFNTGKVSNIFENLKIMEEEDEEEHKKKSLFLRSCGESENQDDLTKGKRRFKCKDFAHDPIQEVEEISDFGEIAAPDVDGVFIEMFDIGCDEGKERLKGFLNAMYFPESSGYKITNVESLQRKYPSTNKDLVVACKCTATNENGSQEISFDFEMHNKYIIDGIGRFSESARLEKLTQSGVPMKLLVLLNRKGESTSDSTRGHHIEWLVFCQLKYDNDDLKVLDTSNQMPRIFEESPQINQIDIKDVVSKILNNESVYFSHDGKRRELNDEALEWIKLFGVDHWVTKNKHERYVVPSGNGITSKSVRNAVSFLKDFNKVRYKAINAQLREDMNNISRERRDATNTERLTSLWDLFREKKGLDNSDFIVRNMIKRNISFSSDYVYLFLESEEENKVNIFLQALKNVGLLKY